MVEGTTANGRVTLRVRALPLPATVAGALSENAALVRTAVDSSQRTHESSMHARAGGHDGSAGAATAQPSGGGGAPAGGAEADVDAGRDQNGATAPALAAGGSTEDYADDGGGALGALQKRWALSDAGTLKC